MTTQQKIILATENPNKAYLTLINSVEENAEFSRIQNLLLRDNIYTTEANKIATATALVNMILNNKI